MKVYAITEFVGHCPVGQSAVIVARGRTHAVLLLRKAMPGRGLNGDQPLNESDLIEIDQHHAGALILQDGNY